MSKVLVLASYCGGEGDDFKPNGCTDIDPCKSCLDACNVFEADLSKASYIAQFDSFKRGGGKYRRAGRRS